jgi:hypothetical protein
LISKSNKINEQNRKICLLISLNENIQSVTNLIWRNSVQLVKHTRITVSFCLLQGRNYSNQSDYHIFFQEKQNKGFFPLHFPRDHKTSASPNKTRPGYLPSWRRTKDII